LEAEVARLQQLDAMVNSERAELANQNEIMKILLSQHSIDAQLGSVSLTEPSDSGAETISMLSSHAIDIRYDEEIGAERTFLDFDEMMDLQWTSPDEEQADERQPKQRQKHAPVKGDVCHTLSIRHLTAR
jgi:head-tail adaptor